MTVEYHKERLKGFKRADIIGVWIISQRDGNVCQECLELDGQEFTI